MAYGPNQRSLQPDPVLTSIIVDQSKTGGWLAPLLCPVKPVGKDYVRWGKRDAKTLLSDLMDTLRSPGARANLALRPAMEWLTSVVFEDAIRVEYTEEDVINAVSSVTPRADAAMKILNVLQFAWENRVTKLFDPSTWAAANKTAANPSWTGGGTTVIEAEVEAAIVTIAQLSGMAANYIRIPRKKWGAIKSSAEMIKLRTGQNPIDYRASGGLAPDVYFFGLKVLFGTPRADTTPTGVFTPAFLWDDASLNLDDTIHIGYSPVLNGGNWDGDIQTFIGCFENQINGTAFAANEYLDPYYQENGVHIVHGNVRRSLPEVFNPDVVFAITGI